MIAFDGSGFKPEGMIVLQSHSVMQTTWKISKHRLGTKYDLQVVVTKPKGPVRAAGYSCRSMHGLEARLVNPQKELVRFRHTKYMLVASHP
jgi:hypothetical protein